MEKNDKIEIVSEQKQGSKSEKKDKKDKKEIKEDVVVVESKEIKKNDKK